MNLTSSRLFLQSHHLDHYKLPEFGSKNLETLRKPLEDKVVTISRAFGSLTFPANFMFVEEYGANALGMSKSDTTFCDGVIDQMTQKGRVTDIHFVIIDQDPRQWSPLLLMCTKAKVIYKVGPNQGTIVGDWHAQELPDTGVFRYRKVEYNAWLMEGERDELLKRIPTNPWPSLMPDVTDWKQALFPGNNFRLIICLFGSKIALDKWGLYKAIHQRADHDRHTHHHYYERDTCHHSPGRCHRKPLRCVECIL